MDLSCMERYHRVLYPHLNDSSSLPTCWSSQDKNNFIRLRHYRMKAHFKGYNMCVKNASCVRANLPIPLACGLFYFEVKIVSQGEKGIIAIGIANRETKLTVLPGMTKGSYGYHGNSGKKFDGAAHGKEYGPVFTTNDIIGCGINFVNGQIFYTKNGNALGNAFCDVPATSTLYPILGLQSKGEIVEVNFGHFPFKYDIETQMIELKASVVSSISEYPINSDKNQFKSTLNSLISSYLIHQGYSATAEAFAKFTGEELNAEDVITMKNRRRIKGLVLSGRIKEVIETTQMLYPNFLDFRPNLMFLLKVLQFIELLSGFDPQAFSSGLLKAAAASIMGTQEMTDFGEHQKTDSTVMELIDLGSELQIMRSAPENVHAGSHDYTDSLLTKAYSFMASISWPVEGPLCDLFEQPQRVAVNNTLDSAILEFLGRPNKPPLELAIEHARGFLELMAVNGIGAYAFANIDHPF